MLYLSNKFSFCWNTVWKTIQKNITCCFHVIFVRHTFWLSFYCQKYPVFKWQTSTFIHEESLNTIFIRTYADSGVLSVHSETQGETILVSDLTSPFFNLKQSNEIFIHIKSQTKRIQYFGIKFTNKEDASKFIQTVEDIKSGQRSNYKSWIFLKIHTYSDLNQNIHFSNLQFTDLGSLIGNTQCGNFRIFPLLRFYVKSILVILKPQ